MNDTLESKISPERFKWTFYFDDGMVVSEADGAHLDSALSYGSKAKIVYIDINDGSFAYGIDFNSQKFGINGTWFEVCKEVITDRIVPILRVEDSLYAIGIEGFDSDKRKVSKVIFVS